MRNKKLFLLPLLLCAVTSCGGNQPATNSHTLTFVGENCYLKDASGKEITTTSVDDGASVNYVVFVKDTESYELPDTVKVEGTVQTYNYNSGILSIDKITSDITITATAKGIEEYEVKCTYVPGCNWTKYPNRVKKNQGFTAQAIVEEGYTLSKDKIHVSNDNGPLTTDQFTFENNILTIDGQYVISDISIFGIATPVIPPVETYKVNFNMEHAHVDSTEPFPSEQALGVPLYGCFVVDEGYRAPTKDELAPPSHPIDGTIRKLKPGVDHHLTQDQFEYGTYYIDSVHKYGGWILIYDIQELSDAVSIEIGGSPVKLVTVTFDPKEGHWQDKTADIKTASVDIKSELDDAIRKCEASVSIDDPSKQFEAWYDKETGKEVYSTTILEHDLNLEAHYRTKEYIVYTDGILGCNITNFPGEKLIKWHEAVGDKDPKPTITVKDASSQLPEKSDVKVTMGAGESKRFLLDSEFIYDLSSDNKSATFGIKPNVIEGDINISLEAYEVITVKFDPDGGYWPGTTSSEIKQKSCKSGAMTYNEIYDSLKVGGNPEKSGLTFDGWYNIEGGVKTPIPWNNPAKFSITITATYAEKPTFENDSWANVIKYANEGTLKEHYGDSFGIGKERSLFYTDTEEGKTYENKVRLIGINHDELADGSGKKAPLTFEFVHLIGNGVYGSEKADYGTKPNNTWATSTYRNYMDLAYKGLKECNPGFDVKKVKKKTMRGKDCGEYTPASILETDETLFPLSGSEMGIPSKNKEINTIYYNFDPKWEGDMYEYYKLGGYYVKTYIGETSYSSYWLRSPHTDLGLYGEPDTGRSYFLKGSDVSGELADYSACMTDIREYGYAAAFCI